MFSRVICQTTRRSIFDNVRMLHALQNIPQPNHATASTLLSCRCLEHPSVLRIPQRFKHSKKKSAVIKQEEEEEEEEEEEDEDTDLPRGTKAVTLKINSLRLDVICKSGFGLARNKVEQMFYNSNIRVNGEKILKKSQMVNVGDEIDLIHSRSVDNPKFLNISRIKIESSQPINEGVKVKILRDKSLLIEDYEDPWHGNAGQ